MRGERVILQNYECLTETPQHTEILLLLTYAIGLVVSLLLIHVLKLSYILRMPLLWSYNISVCMYVDTIYIVQDGTASKPTVYLK